jgi:hypothetical protein
MATTDDEKGPAAAPSGPTPASEARLASSTTPPQLNFDKWSIKIAHDDIIRCGRRTGRLRGSA